jgi:hypothetical protein
MKATWLVSYPGIFRTATVQALVSAAIILFVQHWCTLARFSVVLAS